MAPPPPLTCPSPLAWPLPCTSTVYPLTLRDRGHSSRSAWFFLCAPKLQPHISATIPQAYGGSLSFLELSKQLTAAEKTEKTGKADLEQQFLRDLEMITEETQSFSELSGNFSDMERRGTWSCQVTLFYDARPWKDGVRSALISHRPRSHVSRCPLLSRTGKALLSRDKRPHEHRDLRGHNRMDATEKRRLPLRERHHPHRVDVAPQWKQGACYFCAPLSKSAPLQPLRPPLR